MLIRNTFDGGTNATGMTTGNTGGSSGTAFAAVEVAAVFSNEWSHSGALSMKLPASAISGYGRWTVNERDYAIVAYVNMTAAHTVDYGLISARGTTSSSTVKWTLLLNPANQLRLRIGATGANAWTATASFPLNQTVRIEIQSKTGTTASNGEMRVHYYLGESTTAIADSGWITGLDLQGDDSNTGHLYFGKTTVAAYSGNAYLDSAKINAGTDYTGAIGPEVTPLAAPVVTNVDYVNPTTIGGTNGSITITWSAVTGAHHYEVAIEDGTVTSGFVVSNSNATSPHTFSGLSAGARTWAVMAKAS